MNEEAVGIFQVIEQEIIDSLTKVSAPEEPVYACSFFHFYWDGENIHEPFFTYNIESSESSRDPRLRWHPGDWIYDEHDTLGQAIRPLYVSLSQTLKNEPEEVWKKVGEYQDSLYCNMCMKLNNVINESDSPFAGWNLTDDFVIGVFDHERGDIMEELAKKSVGVDKFQKNRIFMDDPAVQYEKALQNRSSYREKLVDKGVSNETAWGLAVEKYPLPKST